MKLALIPLGLLIFACVFGIAYNFSVTGAGDIEGHIDSYSTSDLQNRTLYSDGSPTELSYESTSTVINFTLSGMMITIFALALGLGAVVGIQVLGSGLSEFSAKSITVIVVMESIWFIFSGFGYSVFDTVPVFGVIMYFVLSLVYAFGVFQEIWV